MNFRRIYSHNVYNTIRKFGGIVSISSNKRIFSHTKVAVNTVTLDSLDKERVSLCLTVNNKHAFFEPIGSARVEAHSHLTAQLSTVLPWCLTHQLIYRGKTMFSVGL